MTLRKVRGHDISGKCLAKDLKKDDVYVVVAPSGNQSIHQALADPEVVTTESGKEAVAVRCRDA